MVCGAEGSLNMNTLDHSDDEEEQSRYATTSNSRFGKLRAKRRSGSQQPLLLMDCVGGSDNGDASKETVPLPDYERLSPSARHPDDPADTKDPPPPPLTPAQQQQQQQTPAKREASSPPQPPPSTQQQKPAAWRLIEYVRSRHRAGGAAAGGGCGAASDGDSKSSEDGEREGEDGGEEGKKDKKKKKRSSWLPDPDRRWPVQGFY